MSWLHALYIVVGLGILAGLVYLIVLYVRKRREEPECNAIELLPPYLKILNEEAAAFGLPNPIETSAEFEQLLTGVDRPCKMRIISCQRSEWRLSHTEDVAEWANGGIVDKEDYGWITTQARFENGLGALAQIEKAVSQMKAAATSDQPKVWVEKEWLADYRGECGDPRHFYLSHEVMYPHEEDSAFFLRLYYFITVTDTSEPKTA